MITLKKWPGFAKKMDKTVRVVSVLLLAIIVLAAILKERSHVVESFITVGPAALLLNITSFALGLFTGWFLLNDLKQSVAISIETGIQNGTLGIMIAATFLKNPAMAIPPAIYSLIMFLVGFVLIYVFSKMVHRHEQAAAA